MNRLGTKHPLGPLVMSPWVRWTVLLAFLVVGARCIALLQVWTTPWCLTDMVLSTMTLMGQFPMTLITVSLTLAPFDAGLTTAPFPARWFLCLVALTTPIVTWLPTSFAGPNFLSPVNTPIPGPGDSVPT